MKNLFILTVALLFIGQCTGKVGAKRGAARQVISLSPNITEIIYALHQQSHLLAVTDFCDYPPSARTKPHIGGLLNPNIERIFALDPNFLIGTAAHSELAEQLLHEGLHTKIVNNDELSDVFASIDSIGKWLDCPASADSLKRQMKDSLAYYQRLSRSLKLKPPGAMLVIGRQPGSIRNITVVGSNNFITSLWEEMGGRNAFNDLTVRYAQVGHEAILARQPDLIIEFRFKEPWDRQKNEHNILEWQHFSGLRAAFNKQLYVLTADYTLIPGPRVYLLARDFYRILEKYEERSEKN